MNAKEIYKQKIEAEVNLVAAKIIKLKADAKNYKADALAKYTKHIDEIQNMFNAVTAKLTELGKASDDSWEKLKEGVERAWKILDTAVANASADKFKHEHAQHTTKSTKKE